jgi:hypothetical protein
VIPATPQQVTSSGGEERPLLTSGDDLRNITVYSVIRVSAPAIHPHGSP